MEFVLAGSVAVHWGVGQSKPMPMDNDALVVVAKLDMKKNLGF